ncbi:MAG: hypothetical protein ACTHN0_09645 [Aquihabitans sp.]
MDTWSGRAEDGAAVDVELSAQHHGALLDRWPPIGLDGPSAGPITGEPDEIVVLDPTTFADGEPTEVTWARLESDLALFAADHLAGRIAIHAALASWHGRTVLLPGQSHAGKSTLALALADLGATVWTDEYALVDPATGRATGWPRPVRRRRADGGIDRVTLPVPDEARLRPMPIDLVAVLRYDGTVAADAGVATEPGTAADVAALLLANTVSARRHPDLALDAALSIARSAESVVGPRGEAAATAVWLLARLEGGAPADGAEGA